MFRDLGRIMKGEVKGDGEVQAIRVSFCSILWQ